MTEANLYAPPTAKLGVEPSTEAPPLWNPDAAGAWSLLFTPIFGSILVRKNWVALNEANKATAGTAWIVISLIMLLPSMAVPGFGLLYIIVWYLLFQKPQTKYVKARWDTSYPRRPWTGALLGGVGAMIGLFVLVFIVAFALAPAA